MFRRLVVWDLLMNESLHIVDRTQSVMKIIDLGCCPRGESVRTVACLLCVADEQIADQCEMASVQ